MGRSAAQRPRPRGAGPIAAALLLGLALTAASAASASAVSVTGMRRGGVTYAPADALARALGDIVVAGEGSLTWRSPLGTLTVFDGSPDALWQASGATAPGTLPLSAPVLLQAGRWWLPLDALDTLGVAVHGNELALPDGQQLTLSLPPPPVAGAAAGSEVDDLGHGVPALRLFAGGGDGGPTVAAMLSDLDMLPLVDPAQRVAIDAALEGSGADKPLLVVVTALQATSWEPTFRLSQDGRDLEFRYPYRMRLVEGTVGKAGPDAPAAVLLLLPPWFNLFRPITVSWQGISGSVTFRR